MKFTFQDAKKLSSLIRNEDKLINKKRRWLMGTSMVFTSDGKRKKSKRPKFLTEKLLPESYVRSDEVSPETTRASVEKSFGSFRDCLGSHHVVQDYLHLFENMESYSVNPSSFLKNFFSIIDNLNNGALCFIANLVMHEKVKFEKIRPRMKNIIKDNLPRVFAESNCEDCLTLLKQLSQILRDPSNFREKQLTLSTPVSLSLLSAIHNTLEGLDDVPFQGLAAINRKLRGVILVPQFPPFISTAKRDLIIGRVRKKCEKVMSTLKEGSDLPKPFAKALSVMRLSLKQRTRCIDILTSEFYPFSPEIVGVQNDILKALWLLPKVRITELKSLQPLVDPEAKVPTLKFRTALNKYLMEYLFQCDEIDIPEELRSMLTSINRRSRRRPRLYSTEIDVEVEAVLNVSSQLKQIVSSLLPDDISDDNSEGLESDDGNESDNFELAKDDCCSSHDEHEQEMYNSCLNYGEVTTGGSRTSAHSARPTTSHSYSLQHCDPYSTNNFIKKQPKLELYESAPITSQSYPLQLTEACMLGDFIKKQPKLEQENGIDSSEHCPKEAAEMQTKDSVQRTGHMSEISVKEICDKTSLIAYRLIGHMLDKFIQTEGNGADEMERYYLRGGSAPSPDSPATEDSLNTSKEDVGSKILIQAVEELLPSMPKSCIEKVKKLVGK